ncbi:type VI secretion system-associated protein TagF [Chitinilyticum litopenaei]|uniref:type VI secretion system-associated protein TagF n=1 Tax=Chitinilyticum litopenaei TaxID=1121276 RepID=UPI000413AC71|nr:type VI secretion system-associated protein TagF [Chitinilyticum litopenaei]
MEKIAFFGKIPAAAEFVGRGLSADTRELLGNWIGKLLVQQAALTAAPLAAGQRAWRFYIDPDLASGVGLLGVMLRSSDSVGREYPLLLLLSVRAPCAELLMQADLSGWFDRMAEIAEAVIERQLTAEQIEMLLDRQPSLAASAGQGDLEQVRTVIQDWGARKQGTSYVLPGASAISYLARNLAVLGVDRLFAGHSVWWRKSSDGQNSELRYFSRLPQIQDFSALDAPW